MSRIFRLFVCVQTDSLVYHVVVNISLQQIERKVLILKTTLFFQCLVIYPPPLEYSPPPSRQQQQQQQQQWEQRQIHRSRAIHMIVDLAWMADDVCKQLTIIVVFVSQVILASYVTWVSQQQCKLCITMIIEEMFQISTNARQILVSNLQICVFKTSYFDG